MRLGSLVHWILGGLLSLSFVAGDVTTEDESDFIEEHPSATWRTVAQQAAALPPVLSDAGEAELSKWAAELSKTLGRDAREPIGMLLCSLPALDRTRLIAAWATSPREELRLGVARALAFPLYAVGVPTAIDVLLHDGDRAVRTAAREAAAVQSA